MTPFKNSSQNNQQVLLHFSLKRINDKQFHSSRDEKIRNKVDFDVQVEYEPDNILFIPNQEIKPIFISHSS